MSPQHKQGIFAPLLALLAPQVMLNLATKARPYFGAVVLTCRPADRRRHLQRHAHAQRRLSGGHVSAHRRRRQASRTGT